MKQKHILAPDFKVGVLGGGQLGKMLGQAASFWHLPLHFLDKSKDFPAGLVAGTFTKGDFKDFNDVYAFGREMDILTIEIEHVNTEALHALEQEGVTIHPNPSALDIIKDKGLQKQFYHQHQLPSAPFQLFPDEKAIRAAIDQGDLVFPFVQKSRTAGYDGRGVAVLQHTGDLPKLLPGPSVVEEKIDMEKELAVIVARRPNGDTQVFPVVEMVFNPVANLVEYLFAPAKVSDVIARQAYALARQTAEAYNLCGLLAVELFLTKEGKLLINEVAPRPHNSGHHTIDSCVTSQFEQHLRAILDLPLGRTDLLQPAVMVNLLGLPNHTGPARYEGMEEIMNLPGLHVHLYGKKMTKPFRKMGHATVVHADLEKAISLSKKVLATFQITSS